LFPFNHAEKGRRLSVPHERVIEGPETIVAQYDDLLRLVTENCTIEQVKAVLRPALGNKNVKLSANSKEELVDKNVRAALSSHSLDVEKVYELLRESEENGPQHIFYLRCPSKDVQS
jgi:hypothetical protein